MQNNKKITSILVIALLMMSTFLVLSSVPQFTKAAANNQQATVTLPSGVTPTVEADTIAHLSFRPHTVGVDQPILINMWIQSETLGCQLSVLPSL